jgi:hypothetical protein
LSESLKLNSSLTTLYISWNKMGDEGIKYLSESLKSNSSLTKLDLDNNKIGKEGIKYLSESLKSNSTLTKLFLCNNEIGDEGMKYLSESLKSNITLMILDISHNCDITDEGMRYLIEALEFNSIIERVIIGKYSYDVKIPQKIKYLLDCNQRWDPEFHNEFSVSVQREFRFDQYVYVNKYHYSCSISFKEAVYTFLLCMKRNQRQTGLKIPKFVLFEIIKVIDRKSFLSFDFPDYNISPKKKELMIKYF